jgi:hypothetical protein
MTEVVLPVWARHGIVHLSYRSTHQPRRLDTVEDALQKGSRVGEINYILVFASHSHHYGEAPRRRLWPKETATTLRPLALAS